MAKKTAAKKKTARKAPKKEKSFEETLWDTANTKGDCSVRSTIIKPKATLQSLTRQRVLHQKLVENDLVDTAPRENAISEGEAIPQVVSEAKDNMIALPGQLFYTTQIPVCLWFLTKNKKARANINVFLNAPEFRLAA